MTTPNEELILKLRGQAYTTCRPDQLCDQAADLLQSQAERIKVIERESEMRRIALHDVMLESAQLRAQLRAQLAGMTANTATDKHLVDLANDTATRLLKERDTLRAEIAGTAAVEPVATLVVEWVFHEYDNSAKEDRVGYVSTSFHRTAAAEKMPIGKYALFTRPMPAKPQDHEIRELVDRPAILFKPRLFPAGDQWCALFGEDLQTGVCGFGASAGDAMRDFDKEWNTKLKARK